MPTRNEKDNGGSEGPSNGHRVQGKRLPTRNPRRPRGRLLRAHAGKWAILPAGVCREERSRGPKQETPANSLKPQHKCPSQGGCGRVVTAALGAARLGTLVGNLCSCAQRGARLRAQSRPPPPRHQGPSGRWEGVAPEAQAQGSPEMSDAGQAGHDGAVHRDRPLRFPSGAPATRGRIPPLSRSPGSSASIILLPVPLAPSGPYGDGAPRVGGDSGGP